jgi:hypothetical protein
MESQENIWTLIAKHALSPEEIERRKRGAQRLKERLSHMPFYKRAEERDGPVYWDRLYASQVNT